MFLQVSVILFTGGLPALEGACLGGACLGGACLGGSGPGGAWWRPPGRLQLWAVRILLECILVMAVYEKIFTHHDSDYFLQIYCAHQKTDTDRRNLAESFTSYCYFIPETHLLLKVYQLSLVSRNVPRD